MQFPGKKLYLRATTSRSCTHRRKGATSNELHRRNARKGEGQSRASWSSPKATRPRTLKAGRIILDEGFASEVTLLGQKAQIEAEAKKQGVSLAGLHVEEPAASPLKKEYVDDYFELRKSKGITREEAEKVFMGDTQHWGAMMMRKGRADAMVSGADSETAKVLRAALTIVKTAPGIKTASSCFVMYLPGHEVGRRRAHDLRRLRGGP